MLWEFELSCVLYLADFNSMWKKAKNRTLILYVLEIRLINFLWLESLTGTL